MHKENRTHICDDVFVDHRTANTASTATQSFFCYAAYSP